jgi:glycosyltransferase involved in cell wall biosynthesis
MANSSFSVVIPTYNRGSFIGEAIDSVLNQTLKPAEIIVVDDGSTDDTKEKLSNLGSRITYLPVENGGVSRARNIGISHSRSEFVAFLDSDDTWEPQYLETQQAQSARFPTAIAYHTNSLLVDIDGSCRKNYDVFGLAPSLKGNRFVLLSRPLQHVVRNMLVFFQTTVVRRNTLLKAGLFAEDIRAKSDLHLMGRLALLGPFSVCTEPLVQIRRRSEKATSSISVKSQRKGIETQLLVDRILSDIAGLPGIGRDDGEALAKARSSTLRSLGNLNMRAGNFREGRNCYMRSVRLKPSPQSVLKMLVAYTPLWPLFDRKGHDVEP